MLLENFIAIMALIGLFWLLNEFADALMAILAVAVGIVCVAYAFNNFDPITNLTLAGITALICLGVWNKRREAKNKRKKMLEGIAKANASGAAPVSKLERQNQPPPSPLPAHNSAERARVLALGKLRDGAKRHPILDRPWVSLANPPENGTRGQS